MLVGHVPFTGESPTVIMLKHMQHSPPSVTDERSDVPPAVGTVVSKALQKRPEHRYETVGQLVEDLTIAAGIEGGAATPTSAPATFSREHPAPPVDDDDEETLVRRRYTRPMAPPPEPVSVPAPMPQPAASFNPWKVLVPAVVGLLLLFGVIYAFTRNSPAPTEVTNGGLAADPNSQPVEATTPPTGHAEVGIPSANANQNANNNTAATPSPSPSSEKVGGLSDNENQNSNTSKNPVIPTPTQPIIVEAPLATPAPTKAPVAKPTLPPPSASPPGTEP
jgi:hypothetical protein